jgi:hypothetical protein
MARLVLRCEEQQFADVGVGQHPAGSPVRGSEAGAGGKPVAERRKETEMGVILTIALVVLVVAVALWFLRRA